MTTSFKTRAAAFAASIVMTFGTVFGLAQYAYPEAPAAVLALGPR